MHLQNHLGKIFFFTPYYSLALDFLLSTISFNKFSRGELWLVFQCRITQSHYDRPNIHLNVYSKSFPYFEWWARILIVVGKFRWDLKNIRPYTSVAINTLKMLFGLCLFQGMTWWLNTRCQEIVKNLSLSSARNWWYLYLLQNIIMSHDDAFALCTFFCTSDFSLFGLICRTLGRPI